MKNSWQLTVIWILLGSQLFGQTAEEEIAKVLDEWHLAASLADFDAYFSRMTDNAVFIGTDATENWSYDEFKAFSKPYFDKGKAWNFTARERNIYVDQAAQVGWFDELLETWMGICRGSGIVRIENGQWKITHYVLSVTIPNDDMNEVIELKKVRDSLLLSELKKAAKTGE